MATSGRGSGVVGYNVQVAVETAHHLIVAHKVIERAVLTGGSSPPWPSGKGCPGGRMNSMPSPIADTSTARKS